MRVIATHQYNRFAAFYDDWHDQWPADATQQCVQTLAELAAGRASLELGIGTGRIALPLSQHGVPVAGIDNAPAMLDKLRAKPGSERLQLVCADFVEMPLPGPFGLIYAVFSLGYLLTQAEQLRCIVNAGRCLAVDGSLVIQTAVPGAEAFDTDGKVSRVLDVPGEDSEGAAVMLLCSQADPVLQRIDQRVVVAGEAGTRIFAERRRYVWPSELDLMAHIAGLRLSARWSSWTRQPYSARSRTQVSIYTPDAGVQR
ncbi:class I SAM-dependent DNA methyltransferase [Xanthomonas theicola]|uniref:SAM-dependent methyltransferase n=1 Tax=Xanthomonas theicola TaxID=56464 RepID=A0A2S6ZBW0_9XANT|nr:class I SAM-dependent methyltransferase [Xanthomonas theicola]PPT86755.1 SAM-dependent methyltransferase [Xanthomonas theicola]QNH23848.1 class I SAM-dependent methyltransferase [Xanthomonas theicola]